MEKLTNENAEFYKQLTYAQAMCASMQYSLSNMLYMHAATDVPFPEDLMKRLSCMVNDLNPIKLGMIELEEKYKLVAWRRE